MGIFRFGRRFDRGGSNARCLFHKGLQNQRRCDLVYDAAMFLARMTGVIQNLVRLTGCKTFVPQVNRETGQHTEFSGEGLRFGGL